MHMIIRFRCACREMQFSIELVGRACAFPTPPVSRGHCSHGMDDPGAVRRLHAECHPAEFGCFERSLDEFGKKADCLESPTAGVDKQGDFG